MDIHIKLSIDDRLVALTKRVRRSLSQRRLAVALGLSLMGLAAVGLAAPLDKLSVFKAGDTIKASEINANFAAISAELEARVVRADQTIKVADCAALKVALASLDDRRIAHQDHADVLQQQRRRRADDA